MKKLLLLLVAVVLAFSFTAVAQEPATQTPTTPKTTTKAKKAKSGEAKEAGAAKEASLKGCLAAGTEPNTWTLTKGKKSYTISGTDLSQHVGHEVKLTGDWETKGKSFKATNVEHVADTCSTMAAKGEKTAKPKKGAKPATPATPPGF